MSFPLTPRTPHRAERVFGDVAVCRASAAYSFSMGYYQSAAAPPRRFAVAAALTSTTRLSQLPQNGRPPGEFQAIIGRSDVLSSIVSAPQITALARIAQSVKPAIRLLTDIGLRPALGIEIPPPRGLRQAGTMPAFDRAAATTAATILLPFYFCLLPFFSPLPPEPS